MENPVICNGRAYVTSLAMSTGVGAAVAIVLTPTSVFLGVILGVFGLLSGAELSRTCHRVELRSEHHLVLHYLFRRRVIRPASITSIKLDKDPDAPPKFVVSFAGGTFEVSANRSARRLMNALLHLEPTIIATGYEPVSTNSAERSGVR